MAVNILETMRQMQRDLADQKEYMRNLHTVNRDLNEKLNVMDERITDLPKAIQRLEHQVKNINVVLFGNDETVIISEGTIMPYKSDIDEKEKAEFFSKKSKNSFESTEVTELLNPSKARLLEETELTGEDERKNDEQFGKPKFTKEDVEEIISNEMEETKQPIQIPNCPFCKQNAVEMSTTYLNADQTCKLEDKLNKITNLYQSDMNDLRKSIKNIEATIKTVTEEAASTVRQQETIQNSSIYFSTEQIKNQINAELKRITDSNQSQTDDVKKLFKDFIDSNKDARNVFSQEQTDKSDKIITICTELKSNAETNQSEMRQMKELMKYFVAKKLPIDASTVSEQKTVEISPTYFSPDQISKLNSELKRVAEIYQGTDMFPVIEVVPEAADEHPIMKKLKKGVIYKERDDPNKLYTVKLGWNGFKRSDVIDMITEYPDLTLKEVIRAWWKTRTDVITWSAALKKYHFSAPQARDKDGNLVPLESSYH